MKQNINNNLPFDDSHCRANPRRRTFLKTACVVAGGLAVGGLPTPGVSNTYNNKLKDTSLAAAMPKIQIGDYAISRLVLGGNPTWGISYQGKMLSKLMLDYFTDDNIVKLLHRSEQAGINTWQTGLSCPRRCFRWQR